MDANTSEETVQPEQAEQMVTSPELKKTMGEFARRVVGGERTADLFGIGDDYINSVVSRAYQLYGSKNFDEAQILLKGAIALDNTRAYPHLLYGDILLQKTLFDEAIAQFERALELRPEDGETLAKLGEAKLRAGQVKQATQILSAAMQALSPESHHHKRASVLCDVARRSERETEAVERA